MCLVNHPCICMTNTNTIQFHSSRKQKFGILTLLHSERPKLYAILASECSRVKASGFVTALLASILLKQILLFIECGNFLHFVSDFSCLLALLLAKTSRYPYLQDKDQLVLTLEWTGLHVFIIELTKTSLYLLQWTKTSLSPY